MKITEIKGDITNVACHEASVIIHQANTMGRMGAGVALALKSKWPAVAQVDRKTYLDRVDDFIQKEYSMTRFNAEEKASQSLLGEFSVVNVPSYSRFPSSVLIYNLYGQKLRRPSSAGCATNYNMVIRGFNNIIANIRDRRFKNIKIAIPKYMGCGLAGGDWRIYRAIIESCFEKTGHEIVIVDFDKNK